MGLKIRGINYDTGTEFRAGEPSRIIWNEGDVIRDMKAIHKELHCNSVNLYGSDVDRLLEAAKIGLSEGLSVSIQPRLIDGTKEEMLAFLAHCAREAERLRSGNNVTLNTGCELSLFTKGFIPGKTFLARIRNLMWAWPLLPLINSRLNKHLKEVIGIARAHFNGAITYGAGSWENIAWDGFDFLGINLYRDKENEKTYLTDLRKLHGHGKQIIITEFGCCTFKGAERMGGGGWTVIDYKVVPPRLKKEYQRDEQIQADLLSQLIDIYNEENIYGAYVFDFMGSQQPYSENPIQDLDMASYGIVKVMPDSINANRIAWERKIAFDAVANKFSK